MELLGRLDTTLGIIIIHHGYLSTRADSNNNNTNIRDMQNDRTTRPSRGRLASLPFYLVFRFDTFHHI